MVPDIREIFTIKDLVEKVLNHLARELNLDEIALGVTEDLGPSGYYRQGDVDYFPNPTLLPKVRDGETVDLVFHDIDLGFLQLKEAQGEVLEDVKVLLEIYLHRLRYVKPILKGADLLSMGFTPGPQVREVLTRLHEAKLDGKAATKQDEEALVKGWLANKT